MVDLPRGPRRLVTTETPRSSLSASDIASPYAALARGMDQAGDALSDIAVPYAEEAAAQAVTRDADGNVQIDSQPFILGKAGAAYRRGVKVAAVVDAEAGMRRADMEMRQEFRNDPDGYLKAADAYRQETVRQYRQAGGAQVAQAVDRLIDREAIQTHRGLFNEKERLDLQRATQSISAEIVTAQNEMYALINGGDDMSSEDFQHRLTKVRSLYGELVGNPSIAFSQERASRELEQMQGEFRAHAVVNSVTRTFDSQGPEAALRAAESIRTDTGLNLTQQQRDSYYGRAVAAVNQRVRQIQTVANGIGGEIAAIDKIAAEGYSPGPERIATLRRRVGEANNPQISQAADAALANLPVVAAWRQMSPAQLEGELARHETHMREGGADERSIALRNTGRTLLATMRRELASDPLGWADRVGAIQVPPIDFAGPNASADMRHRAALADTVAQTYGIAPVYLRPDERRALEIASGAGGTAMTTLARNLADGFGTRAGKVIGEVSTQAPVLAHLGGLLNGGLFGGGSETFAADVAEAVQLRTNREFKIPRWASTPSDAIMTAQGNRTREVYGDAFLMVPNNGRAAEASAQAAYFARAARRGYEPKPEQGDSKAAYDRALQEGAGATFTAEGAQYGGITPYRPGFWTSHRVLVPANIRTDRFRDVINAVSDDDLKLLPVSPQAADGRTYTARDIKSAVPVAVPGGYRFAAGDPTSSDPKWIRGADGNAFVLSIEAIEPSLRQRVPGAFAGGR